MSRHTLQCNVPDGLCTNPSSPKAKIRVRTKVIKTPLNVQPDNQNAFTLPSALNAHLKIARVIWTVVHQFAEFDLRLVCVSTVTLAASPNQCGREHDGEQPRDDGSVKHYFSWICVLLVTMISGLPL
jgi:hypothetical protein